MYALEWGLGTGGKEELINPYKSILANLNKYFKETKKGELPRGVQGWRLFFAERDWDREPPVWMLPYIEPIISSPKTGSSR